jgi:hypothetical protein
MQNNFLYDFFWISFCFKISIGIIRVNEFLKKVPKKSKKWMTFLKTFTFFSYIPPHNRFLSLSSWQVVIKSNQIDATQSLMQNYVCLPMMLTRKLILKYFILSLVLIIVSSIAIIVICLNKMV